MFRERLLVSFTILAALASFFGLPEGALAQQGTIVGRVLDGSTGAPAASALVSVEGTAHRVRTGTDGNYEIRDVAAGVRQVRVTTVGLDPTIREVQVIGGQVVTVDFELATSAFVLEEIVVRGTRTLSVLDVDAPLETPRAIQVLPVELMERAGALDLTEALDLSASVAAGCGTASPCADSVGTRTSRATIS